MKFSQNVQYKYLEKNKENHITEALSASSTASMEQPKCPMSCKPYTLHTVVCSAFTSLTLGSDPRTVLSFCVPHHKISIY
ncbi:hypothetical protein STEG23_007561, partial [Scotinomys teguina]